MNNYAVQLLELSDTMHDISNQFKDACTAYAYHYINFQKLLGIHLMKMIDKKPSMEKIIAEYLIDKDFCEHYSGYITNKALKEGLNAQIEALRSKIMSIQSCAKYDSQMDTFGNII